MLAFVAAALCASPAAAAPPREEASFEWRLPSGYTGVTDDRGTVVATEPYQVRRGPWRIYLRVTGDACRPGGQRHLWTTGSGRELSPRRLGPCRYALRVSREGRYRVRLRAHVRGKRLRPGLRRIVVRDWLIVAIGDSVASGEGVPEAPSFFAPAIWQSARCHRSARAGVARAARQIEDDDGYSSVTFVHLACSGAGVRVGLLGPYPGAVPPRNEPPLEPQVSALEQIARKRQVDAVLVSAGANDVNFSGIATFCARVPNDDCFTEPLPRRFGGDGARTPRAAVRDKLRALRRAYRRLGARLARVVRPARVYVTEYFDPTHDEHGATCGGFFGAIGKDEVEQALSRILAPLNAAVAKASKANGWTLVDGIAPTFRTHGYCAGRQAWVSTLEDSLRSLGGIADRHRGTLHPNVAGHETIGIFLAADLERDLYPGWDFPPRPFPQPDPVGSDGIATGLVVALGLAALLLLPAIAPLALALLPAALLGALLWLGRSTVLFLLLGFAAGILILVDPGRKGARRSARAGTPGGEDGDGVSSPLRDAAEPLLKLAKTARPLLLPLFVVIAIGTVTRSPLLQLVAATALTVFAWRLIVVPEAEKSEQPLGRDRQLLIQRAKHAAKYSGIALAIGLVVVVIARLAGFGNPYFDAIGDWASGLLALAVLLWAVALVVRLFSFATTPLRIVTALLIGLALLGLAAGAGVLPGAKIVGDNWSELARWLGLGALALLALDAAISIAAGVRKRRGLPPARWASIKWGEDHESTPRSAARIGFTAASVAAVLLAVSTGWGLIDAAQRPGPTEPPEEESRAARELALSIDAEDGGMELARRYAPVLVFAEGERWAPVPVGPYVKAATLSGPPDTDPEVASPHDLPVRCPEFGQSHCYQLSIECARRGSALCQGRLREKGRLYRDGAVYVRVLKRGKSGPAEPRGAFVRRGPYRDRLETLIQYWYFYTYNEWRAPVFAGLLVQRHEADWEAVTIGFDKDERPLFIADSAHCAGSWRHWREVEASTRLPGPRTHPLVAVAEGSHANYPSAGEKRSPDWASCAGAPAGATTAISYASNIRDRTEYGWFWFPPAEGWLEAAADRPPMSFPGRWGADGDIVLRNLKANPLGGAERAPATPSLQPLWREPVQTIFCDKYTPAECVRNGE